jgi:iron(III) transport system permease protein
VVERISPAVGSGDCHFPILSSLWLEDIGNHFAPLTKAIYHLLGRIEDGAYVASALGVWPMVFLALSLIMAGVLVGKRMGQLFRA